MVSRPAGGPGAAVLVVYLPQAPPPAALKGTIRPATAQMTAVREPAASWELAARMTGLRFTTYQPQIRTGRPWRVRPVKLQGLNRERLKTPKKVFMPI